LDCIACIHCERPIGSGRNLYDQEVRKDGNGWTVEGKRDWDVTTFHYLHVPCAKQYAILAELSASYDAEIQRTDTELKEARTAVEATPVAPFVVLWLGLCMVWDAVLLSLRVKPDTIGHSQVPACIVAIVISVAAYKSLLRPRRKMVSELVRLRDALTQRGQEALETQRRLFKAQAARGQEVLVPAAAAKEPQQQVTPRTLAPAAAAPAQTDDISRGVRPSGLLWLSLVTLLICLVAIGWWQFSGQHKVETAATDTASTDTARSVDIAKSATPATATSTVPQSSNDRSDVPKEPTIDEVIGALENPGALSGTAASNLSQADDSRWLISTRTPDGDGYMVGAILSPSSAPSAVIPSGLDVHCLLQRQRYRNELSPMVWKVVKVISLQAGPDQITATSGYAATPASANPLQTTTAAEPRISIIEPVRNYGSVAQGKVIDWAFVVKNDGGSDLEIKGAVPACSCTATDFDKVIRPGQTGRIMAHVNTAAFVGPIRKTVTVTSNDPHTPATQLELDAVVMVPSTMTGTTATTATFTTPTHALPGTVVWYDDYDAGMHAVGKGMWSVVVLRMTAAINAHDNESDREPTYGTSSIRYHPHYYRGVAFMNLGKYDQAVSEFARSSGPGEIDQGSVDALISRARLKAGGKPTAQ
jgi:Protein of unknown function (DUF1573).